MKQTSYLLSGVLAGVLYLSAPHTLAKNLDPNDPGDQAILFANACQQQAKTDVYSDEVWKTCYNTYRWLSHSERNVSALTPVQQNKYILAQGISVSSLMALKTTQDQKRVGKSTCALLPYLKAYLAAYNQTLTPEWIPLYEMQVSVETSLTEKCQLVKG